MPSPAFVASVIANVHYWTQRLQPAGDHALTTLTEDWPNITQAVRFGLPLPEAQTPTLDLVTAAFWLVERHGYWARWLPWLERALNLAAADLPRRCLLLDQVGHLRRLNGDAHAALNAHQEQARLAADLGDLQELAHARFHLSEDHRHLHQLAEAEQAARAALELFRQLGSPERQVAAVLNTLGLIAQARGDLGPAAEWITQAIHLYRTLGRPVDLARLLKNLGVIQEAQGDPAAALAAYAEALAQLEHTPSELDKILVALNLGTLYVHQGRLAEAEAVFRRADSPYLRESGQIETRAMVTNNLGSVLLAQGQCEQAEAYLATSLALWRQLGARLMQANTLGDLAEALGRLDQPAAAQAAYTEALALLQAFPDDAWAQRLTQRLTAQAEAWRTAHAGETNSSHLVA